jgi:hypothetical protein
MIMDCTQQKERVTYNEHLIFPSGYFGNRNK